MSLNRTRNGQAKSGTSKLVNFRELVDFWIRRAENKMQEMVRPYRLSVSPKPLWMSTVVLFMAPVTLCPHDLFDITGSQHSFQSLRILLPPFTFQF